MALCFALSLCGLHGGSVAILPELVGLDAVSARTQPALKRQFARRGSPNAKARLRSPVRWAGVSIALWPPIPAGGSGSPHLLTRSCAAHRVKAACVSTHCQSCARCRQWPVKKVWLGWRSPWSQAAPKLVKKTTLAHPAFARALCDRSRPICHQLQLKWSWRQPSPVMTVRANAVNRRRLKRVLASDERPPVTVNRKDVGYGSSGCRHSQRSGEPYVPHAVHSAVQQMPAAVRSRETDSVVASITGQSRPEFTIAFGSYVRRVGRAT